MPTKTRQRKKAAPGVTTTHRNAEAEYQTIIRTAMDGFWLSDMEGRFLDVNEAFCHLIGYSRNELLNMSIPDIEAIERTKDVARHIRKINRVGYDRFETRHRRKDGGMLDVEVSVNYLSTDGGRHFVFVRDVTERKRAEEALRQSEERYRTLFNSKLDGVCVMDETMKVLLVNQAAADIFGFDSVDEVLGANPFDLIPPEERDRVLDIIKKDMFAHDLQQVNELHLTNKSGRDIWISAIGTLTEYQGKLAGLISFRDITERKRAEEALQESEAKYRSLVEASGAAVAGIDLQGNFVFVNEAACKMTGYSQEELVGRAFVDVIHPDDVKRIADLFVEAFANPELRPALEFRVVHKDGRSLWLYTCPTPIFYEGTLSGASAIIIDITERKRAEEELQESEEKFRSLFDNSADAMFLTIPDGRIIAANPASFRMFGYTEEEFRQYGRNAILDANDPSVKAALEQRARTGKFQGELTFRRKDGTRFPGEISSFVFKDKDGQSKTSMVVRDITERRRVEEAMRQSEERYRTVLEEMEEGYFETDISGNFAVINEATCRVLGYPREEIIGANYRVFVTKEYVDSVYQVFNQIYQTGTPMRQLGWEITEKDGGRKFIEASVSPLRDQEGQFIGFRGIGRDITERKKMELALQQEKERTQMYLDIAAVTLLVLDADGKVSMINRKGCELLGYKAEDVVGKSWFNNFIPNRIRHKVRDVFKKLMSGEFENTEYSENTVVTKGGEERCIAWHNSLIKDDTGKFVGVLSSGEDITERKRAEEALANEATRRRILFDQSRDGIVILDEDAGVVDANQRFAEMLGYSPEEVRKLHTWDWDTESSREELLNMGRGVDEAGMYLETKHRRKDGTVFDVGISINKVIFGGQRLIFCVCRDITERKQTEEAVRENEKRYRFLVELSPEAILVTSGGKHVFVNGAGVKLLGADSPEQIIGKLATDFVHPDYREVVVERMRKAIETGTAPPLIEEKFIRLDGTVIDVEVRAAPMVYQGKMAMQAIISDITERKKAEEALTNEAIRRRILFDQSRDGIVILDEDAGVVEANQRFAEMLGYSPEEVHELHTWDWDTEFTRKELLNMGRGVDEAGIYLETKHRRKDGTVFDVGISINKVTFGGQRLIFCVDRDITERKQAEEMLAKEAIRRRILIEQSRDGIVVLEENGKVYEVNQRFAEMLGYSLEEARELNVWDWEFQFPPEQVREMIGAVDEKGDHFETRHRRKDGSIYDVEISTNGAIIAGQKLIFCVCRDVSTRKKAEEALVKSEERYRSVLEQMEEAYYEVDIAGNFTFFNDATCQQLGYSREELMGMNYRVYTSKNDVQHVYKTFNRVYRTGKPYKGLPVVRIRKDGSQLSTETSAFPLRNESGEIIGFRGVARDITEQKKAEEALAASEAKYRSLVETSGSGFAAVDLEGKVTFANKALCQMLGYQNDELLGRSLFDFLYRDDIPDMIEKFSDVVTTGQIKIPKYEFRLLKKNGDILWTGACPSLLTQEGRFYEFITVIEDITESKQAEEKVKKLYSLQTAIRYINESLLKVDDEQALFEQVCRFISDVEFVKFCWIGLADVESLRVKPVAYSGFEDGYLSSLKIRIGGSAYYRGPVGVAIKTRQPCTVADIENDSRFTTRREAALKRGYASSLAVPLIHDNEAIGVLSVYSGSKGAFGDAEVEFLSEAAGDIALGISTLRLRRELQQSLSSLGRALEGTVSALASVAEVRDPYTAGHQQRVTRLAVAIATEMGLPQEQIEGLHVAGSLHDVGKLYVPAEILSKPGKLTEVEFNLVKIHSQASYDILKNVEFPWPVAQIVLQHHERLDGSGYPQGLKGEDILLEAKILAVADVVEAMASHRPYRPALGIGQALDEIAQKSGILYDSKVVDACFKLFYDKEFKLD